MQSAMFFTCDGEEEDDDDGDVALLIVLAVEVSMIILCHLEHRLS